MKRIVATFLISSFLLSSQAIATPTLEGHAEFSDNVQQMQQDLFTGEIEHLERKDIIHMTVSQVLDSSIHMEGDEFFAEVTNEVYGDKGVIIPKGTLAHGKITQTADPGKMGKSAWIELDFDYLVTPDGREIPIEGKMTTKLNPVAETSKIIAQDVGYTLVGGAVGGFMALNWLGLESAIASQGYTLAGGAAVGGAIGLGMALMRKGNEVLIAPGDEIRVKINTTVPLPVYKDTALQQHELNYPGLDINISNIIHEEDPFGELNTITLTVMISNLSDKNFSGLDMALISDYNKVFRPSVFGDTKLMFKHINSGDRLVGNISFSVDNINRSFWLAFFDKRSGKPLAKISIDNAYRKLPERTKKKNLKMRKKNTNYKKEPDVLDDI
ncbi:hypothetical protein J6A31_01585 [bacterium]|nr:hypothetical protein [bacterium]